LLYKFSMKAQLVRSSVWLENQAEAREFNKRGRGLWLELV